MRQFTRVLSLVNPGQDGASKRLELSVDGPLFVIGSRINLTGDPVTLLPVREGASAGITARSGEEMSSAREERSPTLRECPHTSARPESRAHDSAGNARERSRLMVTCPRPEALSLPEAPRRGIAVQHLEIDLGRSVAPEPLEGRSNQKSAGSEGSPRRLDPAVLDHSEGGPADRCSQART